VIDSHRSTISRSIIDLEKTGLIKCLNPNAKMTRFYVVTSLGKKILDKIKEMEY
jgi:DNA-binding MarR family transcriptional regulator